MKAKWFLMRNKVDNNSLTSLLTKKNSNQGNKTRIIVENKSNGIAVNSSFTFKGDSICPDA